MILASSVWEIALSVILVWFTFCVMAVTFVYICRTISRHYYRRKYKKAFLNAQKSQEPWRVIYDSDDTGDFTDDEPAA